MYCASGADEMRGSNRYVSTSSLHKTKISTHTAALAGKTVWFLSTKYNDTFNRLQFLLPKTSFDDSYRPTCSGPLMSELLTNAYRVLALKNSATDCCMHQSKPRMMGKTVRQYRKLSKRFLAKHMNGQMYGPQRCSGFAIGIGVWHNIA